MRFSAPPPPSRGGEVLDGELSDEGLSYFSIQGPEDLSWADKCRRCNIDDRSGAI